MPPLRVLVVTHVFPRTAEDPNAPFLLRHVAGIVGRGVEVLVLAPHDPALPTLHLVAGVAVRRVRYAPRRLETIAYRGEMHVRARTPAGAITAASLVASLAAATRRAVARWRPDVIDAHWLVPGAIAATLGAGHVPVLTSVHGTDVALARSNRAVRAAARAAIGRVAGVVAMSTALDDDLRAIFGRGADWVAPVPPKAPPDPPRPRPSSAVPRVLAVGRLVSEKGLLDLVDAVAMLADRSPRPQLTIVGDGRERDAIAARARTQGVDVRLTGAITPEGLEDEYAAADVVVVPSHREGFGLVAAEALLRQRPVVATTAGGLAEIVRDGDTGWSVPPHAPAALARAIAAVIDDPMEAERRARAGAHLVNARWSPDALAADAVSRLAAVAAAGSGRGRR